MPYITRTATTLVDIRFSGGQYVTCLIASSGGYANMLTLSYYDDVTINCFRYHATTGWKKYTFTGTVV